MSNSLVWKEEERRIIYRSPVFDVGERICRSPDNTLRTFAVLDTRDWAIVVPVLETGHEKKFVMVRQWRPGTGSLSLEFPGGVFEKNEDSEKAAYRELREETGYAAGSLVKLGTFNPNPAIMSNTVHFYLAENLTATGILDLDDDEYVHVETLTPGEVFEGMGRPPFIHALMGTALALYLKKTGAGAC